MHMPPRNKERQYSDFLYDPLSLDQGWRVGAPYVGQRGGPTFSPFPGELLGA